MISFILATVVIPGGMYFLLKKSNQKSHAVKITHNGEYHSYFTIKD